MRGRNSMQGNSSGPRGALCRRGLALGLTAAAAAIGLAARPAPRKLPLGVQLWTVKDELEADLDGTLGHIRAIGYRLVETAGLHGRTAEAFAQALARAGLECRSAHVSMPDLERDPA